MQREAGFLAQVHPVAAQPARRKTVAQLFDLRRQLFRALCLQCQRVAQQQRIRAGLVAKQRKDLR